MSGAERPDLADVRERLGVLNSNTWGFLRAADGLWRFSGSVDCVSALAELVDDTQALLEYAARLEREAEALQERLRAMEWDEETDTVQCAWCMSGKDIGHDDGCKFAALLAAEREGGGAE